MKKKILILLCFTAVSAIGQIETPNNGFLPSRVTTTERINFVNPAKGLIVFDTDLNTLMINTTTGVANWVALSPPSATSALVLPVGTTTQRPIVPVQGMIRYNTTLSKFESYNGTSWSILN